jgi:hypothetical protein
VKKVIGGCPSEGDEAFCFKVLWRKVGFEKNEIALVVTSVKRGSTKLVQALSAYSNLCVEDVCKGVSESNDSNSLFSHRNSPSFRVFGFVTF